MAIKSISDINNVYIRRITLCVTLPVMYVYAVVGFSVAFLMDVYEKCSYDIQDSYLLISLELFSVLHNSNIHAISLWEKDDV